MVFPAPAGGSILVPSYTKILDTVAVKPFLETLTDTMQPQDSLNMLTQDQKKRNDI